MLPTARIEHEVLKLVVDQFATASEGVSMTVIDLVVLVRRSIPDATQDAMLDVCTGHLFPEFLQLRKYDTAISAYRDYKGPSDWQHFFWGDGGRFFLKRTDKSLRRFEVLGDQLAREKSKALLAPVQSIHQIAASRHIEELIRHVERIRQAIEADPEQAIGSAKELLETVLRTVTGDSDQKPTEDIPTLLKKAQKTLDLDPKDVHGRLPRADAMRRTLSNLGQIVIGVAELRTLYGTGHGRSKSRQLELAHARLIVNAAISLATFLLELWEEKQG